MNSSGKNLGMVINFVPQARRGNTKPLNPKIWKKGNITGSTSWKSAEKK